MKIKCNLDQCVFTQTATQVCYTVLPDGTEILCPYAAKVPEEHKATRYSFLIEEHGQRIVKDFILDSQGHLKPAKKETF